MMQLNVESGKKRAIRQPRKRKQPAKPVVPPGPTTVITVPQGSPGTMIQAPFTRGCGT